MGFRGDIIKNLILKFKEFNNKHKSIAKIAIVFELIIIVIVSFFSYLKKRLPVVLLIIAAIVLAIFLIKNAGGSKQGPSGDGDNTAVAEASIIETSDLASGHDSSPDSAGSGEASSQAGESDNSSQAGDDSKSEDTVKETGSDNSDNSTQTEDTAKNGDSAAANNSQDKADSTDLAKTETESTDSAKPESNAADSAKTKAEVADSAKAETESADDKAAKPDTSSSGGTKTSKSLTNTPAKELPGDIDCDSFKRDYPETAAWIWFEDGTISYPVMQTSDNTKYKSVDYTGAEARTGSIFLDSRSSDSFTDPNTIIYGHNMSDGTMFGIFKKYKYDRTYLKGHEYFQIITKDGTQRYRIFAYMDLPKSSELYNICGPGTDKMKTLTDYLEHRTYIDSGIEAKPDDQLVMLSTCTDKDDLYFVVFGMRIE